MPDFKTDEDALVDNAAFAEAQLRLSEVINKHTDAPALSNEAVTGHTASLWKYLPVPADEPEPHDEYANRTLELPGGRVLAARVRGKKHKHEGTNCDDWYEIETAGDMIIVAVSDGAGSKKYSRIGARESCKAAAAFLKDKLTELAEQTPGFAENICGDMSSEAFIEVCGKLAGALRLSFSAAYEAIVAAFEARRLDMTFGEGFRFKDLSGTLLVSVIVPAMVNGAQEHLVISCQIGDGATAVMNTSGTFGSSLRILSEQDKGEFSGETDFLTSSKLERPDFLGGKTRIYRGAVNVFMSMTDGVADDYFPSETELYRLYFDLVVNGVLGGLTELPEQFNKEHIGLIKKLPAPLSYPWINDPSQTVALQYTKRICEALGLTYKEIWERPEILFLASEMEKVDDPSERLKIWLDNYVERGSFDDRTLVIVKFNTVKL